MRFRIYYGDGSTHDGPPQDAPGRNVQVIAYEEAAGLRLVHGKDYYGWRDRQWHGMDLGGLFDHLGLPGWTRVLQGRTARDEAFYAILDRARREGVG